MDRFFLNPDKIDIETRKAFLEGEDVKHIVSVLRLKLGDQIELSDGRGNEYLCEILDSNRSSVELKIVEKLEISREANIKVIAYQGLPKGQKTDLICQKLTELGVGEIVLVDTDRSVSKISGKSDKKLERWQRIIYEAAKQSKRSAIPKIRGPISFKEALEEMDQNDYNIFPYEDEHEFTIKKRLSSIKNDLKNKGLLEVSDINSRIRIGFLVGPEGGFSNDEIEAITSKGYETVTFGNRILRTETAGLYTLSLILYELEMEG